MIPVYEPYITDIDRMSLIQAFDSKWISSQGEKMGEFRSGLEQYLSTGGSPVNVSLVANGTVALHLALLVAGVGPGDEVIVPSLTYVATVNAVLMCGATPVFVDSETTDWNISPMDVANKISNLTKAIIVVHLYGYSANLTEIMKISQKFGIKIIEDCAESFGTFYLGSQTGTLGDISTFSFFGNKTITTGEGGAVVVKDKSLFAIIEKLKNQGNSEVRYVHDVLGYNYRMTNLQAAIGVSQLIQLPEILDKKKYIHEYYRRNISNVVTWQVACSGSEPNVWINSFLLPSRIDSQKFQSQLLMVGVETRPLFKLINKMSHINMSDCFLPVAEDISLRGICIPSSPLLNEAELEFITFEVNKLLNQQY